MLVFDEDICTRSTQQYSSKEHVQISPHGTLYVAAEESPKLFRMDYVLLPLLASKVGQGMLAPKDNMR